MLDQHEIAVTLQLVAGIGDRAVGRGVDRVAIVGGDIDAVIALAVARGAEIRDHVARHRPDELHVRIVGGRSVAIGRTRGTARIVRDTSRARGAGWERRAAAYWSLPLQSQSFRAGAHVALAIGPVGGLSVMGIGVDAPLENGEWA